MKLAITGGTGFIGGYIVNRMAESGHDCRCWHRLSSDLTGIPADQSASGLVEWMPGDLRSDAGGLAKFVEGCDAVIHSALDRPGRGFRNAEGDLATFVETNLLGTIRLIEAAVAAGVPRFIFISTCAVHEEILDDRPLDEAHPLWPKTHYGAHKAAIEKFVHSYGLGAGYDICALRPSGVYGVTRQIENSKWHDLIAAVARGETVECTRGGKEVHASDVAKACEILLTADGIAGQAYSCCDGYISEFDVAYLAKQLSGSQAKIVGEPKSPKHQIVTEKLASLGMQFGGKELLKDTIAHIARNCA